MLSKQIPRLSRALTQSIQARSSSSYNGIEPYANMGPLPEPPQPHRNASTRMYWMPESLFALTEEKLGYTGGYTLTFGALATLWSKEIICPHTDANMAFTFAITLPFLGWVIYNGAIPYYDREDEINAIYKAECINEWKNHKIQESQSEIDGFDKLKDQAEALLLIQQQRKNNVLNALEAESMKRQADLVDEVKKRLDYKVAINNATRDAQQKHMINWIQNEVSAAIAKRSSKDDLATAIGELQAMAKKA